MSTYLRGNYKMFLVCKNLRGKRKYQCNKVSDTDNVFTNSN